MPYRVEEDPADSHAHGEASQSFEQPGTQLPYVLNERHPTVRVLLPAGSKYARRGGSGTPRSRAPRPAKWHSSPLRRAQLDCWLRCASASGTPLTTVPSGAGGAACCAGGCCPGGCCIGACCIGACCAAWTCRAWSPMSSPSRRAFVSALKIRIDLPSARAASGNFRDPNSTTNTAARISKCQGLSASKPISVLFSRGLDGDAAWPPRPL